MRFSQYTATAFIVLATLSSLGRASAQDQPPAAPPPPAPGTTVTTERTETTPDGRIITTKTTVTRERGRTPRPSEFGLKHPFRLSFGGYYIDSTDDFDSRLIDQLEDKYRSGGVLKLDYSFFRPTRHEAMVSVYAFGKTDFPGDNTDVIAMLEYRFRFGGFGKGYYGLQIGTGVSGWGKGNLLAGSSLGVDLSPSFFIESRHVGNVDNQSYRQMLMIGTRF